MNKTLLFDHTKLYDLLIKVDDLKNVKIIHKMKEKDSKKFDYKIFSMSLPLLFTRKGLDREAVKICTDRKLQTDPH